MANPTATAPDPLPGDFSTDREADRRVVVHFVHTRVNDGTVPIICCRVASQYFLVYDGTGFVPLFAGSSTVEESADDFTFDVAPAGGWWGEAEFFGWDGIAWDGQVGVGEGEEQ